MSKEPITVLHSFCVIWRDYVLVDPALARIHHASTGDVVTETAEGHWVFATLPCEGQRRLAIVVAAETLPFLFGGSFCV